MVAEFRGVAKAYGRRTVLGGVTLSIAPGEVVGLIGPNGAGKTTLLRVAAGLIRPSAGGVRLAFPPSHGALRYFGGEHTLPGDVSVRRWQSLWMPARPVAAGRIRVLSRGTRQRLGLVAALRLPGPTFLILDEPWEGLDPDASRWLSESLVDLALHGSAVLVSSHRIHDLADVFTRCVFLVQGQLTPAVVDAKALAPGISRSAQLFDAFDRSRGGV